ncbi:ABC transporter ATP-binding protein [Halomarina rubra]|uniref:ATP-binding cassette domain-containing protein n=1 Tax=Halomarina rubra TaxID=2071873 RepID=A0ABD6AS28_9EURY|nr:ABC transporter ATP-binding protein [Halomarina rubra]
MHPVSSTTDDRPDGSPRPDAIRAQHVSVTYASGTEAVKDVSLTVPEGEFFGFLGPNGAGKTTTIKALVTLLDPTGGTVTVNGFDVRRDRRALRASVGYMAQETSVDLELTARENIRFACEAYGVPRAERAARIDELLDLVDLAAVADDQAKTYSGGMKKRLDVATALVHRPPLVFLDEPTTGLDPKARNRLWEYFREINDAGTTVFLTTQYLEEADQLCDRLAVIDDGHIVAEGTPAELKARVGGDVLDVDLIDDDESSRDRAVRVVRESGLLDGEGSVSRTETGVSVTSLHARRVGTDLLVALRDAGVAVEGFEVHSPTLDDVFLAITGTPASERATSADGESEPSEGPTDQKVGR